MTTTERTDRVGVEHAEEFARTHPGLVKLGRLGWIAKGVVYALVGFLALTIALDTTGAASGASSSGEADPGGAIAQIAATTYGPLLMYVIATGLVLYSAWRIVSALLPSSTSASSVANRIGYLISAATYLLLAYTAVLFARHPGNPQENEDSKIGTFTADLLARSYGRQVVFVVGLVLIAIAATFLWKAVTASFTKELAPGSVGPVSHETLVRLGRIGWTGRAAMMGLIGFFFCRAALRFDPNDAQGLDGSLRNAATTDIGTVLVLVVAAGLFVYGVFCILSAPRTLLVAADK